MAENNINKTLDLLDIDEFITKNQCRKVTSPAIFIDNKSLKFHPDGVYSEEIFGRKGSRDRMKRFGYIETNFIFIHPIGYELLTTLFGKQVIDSLKKMEDVYILKNGAIVKKVDNQNNITQVINAPEQLYNILKEVKSTPESYKEIYEFYIEQDEKTFNRVLELLDRIFINKWLIIPAGVRDIVIQPNGTYREFEISEQYRYLIDTVNQINELLQKNDKQENNNKADLDDLLNTNDTNDNNAPEQIKKLINLFYLRLQKITDMLLNNISGKTGLFRGSKLSKRVDHVVRLVLGHNRNLDLNQVGIPWMFLIKLYEPFVVYHITKNPEFEDLKEFFKNQIQTLSLDNFRDYFNEVVKNPEMLPENIKNRIIEILDIIINGKYNNDVPKYVLVIRHPVESSDSILFLRPVIIKENEYVAQLPQSLFATLGADCDGDQINIYALHTKEANIEASTADPKYSLRGSTSIVKYTQDKASTDMDLSIAIYELTNDKYHMLPE